MNIKKAIVCFLAFVAFSCQTEESVVNEPTTDVLRSDSPLTTMIGQVVQAETSRDNVIDNTSCYRVALPVTLYANGQEITIASESGYDDVLNIFSQSSTDDDTIVFQFPITVVFRDHTSMTVDSQTQLDAIFNGCPAESSAENRCIDFNYPVSFNVYDTGTQSPSMVTVSNDASLFEFIDTIEPHTLVTFVYPISLVTASGQTFSANSNEQLEEVISTNSGTCDESPLVLQEIITDGEWFVSYFYNEQNNTFQYNGYAFDFHTDGTITTTYGSLNTSGTWAIFEYNGQQMLELYFVNPQLSELISAWKVDEFMETEVLLRENNGGSDPNQLHFSKL